MGNSFGRSSLKKGWVQALLFLPLTLLLLYLAFRRVDPASLVDSLRKARWNFIVAALLLSLLSHLVRAHRWTLLLNPVSERPVSTARCFYALMVGYFFNLLLPRVGEVVRCVHLQRLGGPKGEESFGTVISERLFDLLMFLLLTLVAVALSINRFGAFLRDQVFTPFFDNLRSNGPGLALILLLAAMTAGVTLLLLGWRGYLGKRFQGWLHGFSHGIIRGIRSVLSLERPLLFITDTLLLWLLYWAMTWMIVLSFPTSAGLPLSSSLILLVVGTFGMLIPVQGGIGSYHLAVMLWLEVEGLTRTEGLALATISHGLQMLIMLVVPALLYLYYLVRKPTPSNPVAKHPEH